MRSSSPTAKCTSVRCRRARRRTAGRCLDGGGTPRAARRSSSTSQSSSSSPDHLRNAPRERWDCETAVDCAPNGKPFERDRRAARGSFFHRPSEEERNAALLRDGAVARERTGRVADSLSRTQQLARGLPRAFAPPKKPPQTSLRLRPQRTSLAIGLAHGDGDERLRARRRRTRRRCVGRAVVLQPNGCLHPRQSARRREGGHPCDRALLARRRPRRKQEEREMGKKAMVGDVGRG